MYLVTYRYPVPLEAEQAFIELQRKVSAIYLASGCRRYVLAKPAKPGGEWMEMSFYDSSHAYETTEKTAAKTGTLNELFQEFLRLTRTSESDLQAQIFDVVFSEGEES